MTTLSFTKGHSAGNDFLLVSDPGSSTQLSADQIRFLCDRHFGVGADGVIRAVRTEVMAEGGAILAEEPEAQWLLDLHGPDGEPVAMCGNAIRVFADFLIEEGLISPERRDTIPIGTRAGVRDVLAGASGYTVDLGRWRLGEEYLVNARGLHVSRPGLGIELAGHHIVTVLSDEAKLAALDLGQSPEFAPEPNGGAASEFVVPEDPFIKDGVARVRMRGHVPGSGEVLSHGSGAAAVALAFRHWGGEQMPHSWRIDSPGGKLAVRMFPTEEGEHVSLSGPVELTYRGTIELPQE